MLELFLVGALVGAGVGFLASQKRGFSPVAGVLAGALLGPLLACLLFLVSDKTRRRCPHCAEPIRLEAAVCPHCRRRVDGHAPDKYKARFGPDAPVGQSAVRPGFVVALLAVILALGLLFTT